MMLSDYDICRFVASGDIYIENFSDDMVQPASVELTLGSDFSIYEETGEPLDPTAFKPWDLGLTTIGGPGGFVLYPGQFALGTTAERVKLAPTISAQLNGKSSLGRMGLTVHVTAGFIDPGFEGHITLEMVNLLKRPLLLTPGMRIAQLAFFKLSSASRRPYGHASLGSHYQGQSGLGQPKPVQLMC